MAALRGRVCGLPEGKPGPRILRGAPQPSVFGLPVGFEGGRSASGGWLLFSRHHEGGRARRGGSAARGRASLDHESYGVRSSCQFDAGSVCWAAVGDDPAALDQPARAALAASEP